MKPYPLQLERYFFTKIELTAHIGGDPTARYNVENTVSLGQHEVAKDKFLVTLRVVIGPEAGGKPTQYTGTFEIHGYVSVLPDCPADKREEVVSINGPGILYGAVREMATNLTSRGPWPSVLLEVMAFGEPDRVSTDPRLVGKPMPEMGQPKPSTATRA